MKAFAPMEVRLEGNEDSVMFVHIPNASSPIVITVSGSDDNASAVQLANALSGILLILGKEVSASFEQPAKADAPIPVTFVGRLVRVIALQL